MGSDSMCLDIGPYFLKRFPLTMSKENILFIDAFFDEASKKLLFVLTHSVERQSFLITSIVCGSIGQYLSLTLFALGISLIMDSDFMEKISMEIFLSRLKRL